MTTITQEKFEIVQSLIMDTSKSLRESMNPNHPFSEDNSPDYWRGRLAGTTDMLTILCRGNYEFPYELTTEKVNTAHNVMQKAVEDYRRCYQEDSEFGKYLFRSGFKDGLRITYGILIDKDHMIRLAESNPNYEREVLTLPELAIHYLISLWQDADNFLDTWDTYKRIDLRDRANLVNSLKQYKEIVPQYIPELKGKLNHDA